MISSFVIGCCGVVLTSDLQQYMNSTLGDGKKFRGSLNFLVRDQSKLLG